VIRLKSDRVHFRTGLYQRLGLSPTPF
jgi:hypothetical protein